MKSVFHLRQVTRLAGPCIPALMLLSAPALAHHPMGGRTPGTFLEGLLSGFGHPIIGLDHFAFLLAIGLLAIGGRQRLLIPAGFVLMTVVGTLAHLAGVKLWSVEAMVATSVLVAGGLLLANRRHHAGLLGLLGAAAGLFHGYAYGESIVGAEATPLLAYLAGFSIVQLCVALATTWCGARLVRAGSTAAAGRLTRAAGTAVCAVGIVYLGLALHGAA